MDLVRRMTITDVKPTVRDDGWDGPKWLDPLAPLEALFTRNAIEQERKAVAIPYGAQQLQATQAQGYSSSGPKPERNQESITGRMDQLIYGLNGALHTTQQIQNRIWGPTPEPIGNSIGQQVEPPANVQLDMLQAKITELQPMLEAILKAL